LRVGALGGTSLTSDYSTFCSGSPFDVCNGSGSRSPIGGPSVEWMFTDRVSIEGNAIYRRLRREFGGPTVTWEFPVLAKYRIPFGTKAVFLEAGPSFRTTGNRNTEPSHTGIAAGAGFDVDWGRFRFSPTARYTRWSKDPAFTMPSKPDQLELLFGLSYGAESDRHWLGRRVRLGVVAGANLISPASAQRLEVSGETFLYRFSRDYKRSWVLGPRLELELSKRWSASVEANHRRLLFTDTILSRQTTSTRDGKSAVLWQFPALVRYHFPGAVQPYLEAGPTFRLPQEIGAKLGTFGAAAGAGVRFRWRALHFEPGLRFSHWGPAKFPSGETAPNEFRRNQFDFVFAATF